MTDTRMIGELAPGDLDFVGDVHGEIASLDALLQLLGYSGNGPHPDGRTLVFVGDLVDRGPDSVGVVRRVARLVETGAAQCILGNHELNILRGSRKRDNDWYFEHTERSTQDEVLAFIQRLPLALERPGLRAVHACWHTPSIDRARNHHGDTLALFLEAERNVVQSLHDEGVIDAAEREKVSNDLSDPHDSPAMLRNLAECDVRKQMDNPVKVLTSGVERISTAPFFANGKWRFAKRVPWWNEYEEDTPVVVGHYWRSRDPDHSFVEEPGLFGDAGPTDSLGAARRVMCIDYSIGRRPKEREQFGNHGPFRTALAAYRVRPDAPNELVFSPV